MLGRRTRLVRPTQCTGPLPPLPPPPPPPPPSRARQRLRVWFLSNHSDPVLSVTIKGNCVASRLAEDALEAARQCVNVSTHAGCRRSEEQPLMFYTGLHLARRVHKPIARQLLGESRERAASSARDGQRAPVRTLSLLDQGLCEVCRAPASLQLPAHVTLRRRRRLGGVDGGGGGGEDGGGGGGRLGGVDGGGGGEDEAAAWRGAYNLTYLVEFDARVAGPHLVYVRLDFASAAEAGAGALDPPTPLDAGAGVAATGGYRGRFLGQRVAGSPFRVDVAAHELPPPPPGAERPCTGADLSDLAARGWLQADDATTARQPPTKWAYRLRHCALGAYRGCDRVARCLQRSRLSLLGDSPVEGINYAFMQSLLPGDAPDERAHAWRRAGRVRTAGWFYFPCLSFNPRYLMVKRVLDDASHLDLPSCEGEEHGAAIRDLQRRLARAAALEARRRAGAALTTADAREAATLPALRAALAAKVAAGDPRAGRGKGRASGLLNQPTCALQSSNQGSVTSLLAAARGWHDEATVVATNSSSKSEGGGGGVGGGGGGGGGGSSDCAPQLAMNLAGVWQARSGNLSGGASGGYAAALRTAMRRAAGAGFARIFYLTTVAAHPINYPHSHKMPRLFWTLTSPRTALTNSIARDVLRDFPSARIVDLHPLTALMEEAGAGCYDIRHYSAAVNHQLMSLVLAATCSPEY